MREGGQKLWVDTAVIALAAAAARLIVLVLLPAGAESVDLHSWQIVANELHAGRNPYQSTPFLNWPPLWMQLIALIDRLAPYLHVPFKTLLRLVLIAFDVGLVVAVHRVAVFLQLPMARLIVLAGLALNPIALLLICQHANFDTIVALMIVLAIASLLRFGLSNHPVDWLFAALALGIGILAKTIPLILVPLLLAGWRKLDLRTRVLGAILLAGPVVLGLSVLFALVPGAILQHVIQYRSFGGTFGISGIVAATLNPQPARLVRLALLLVLGAVVLLASARAVMRDANDPRRLILLGAFLLTGIILLGPGYGPQYVTWFLPLLTLTATSFGVAWRRILVLWGSIAIVTYILEYALLPSHGALLVHFLAGEHLVWAGTLGDPARLTLLRLPLFLSYCLLWGKAAVLLAERQPRTNLPDAVPGG